MGIYSKIKNKSKESLKLGDFCDAYQPQTIPQKKFKTNGLYPVYGANGIIGFYDKYNHQGKQVIVGCRGNCGSVNLTEEKSWINGNAMVIKPKNGFNLITLFYLLHCVNFNKITEKSGVPQITCSRIKEIRIPTVSNEQIIESLILFDKKINVFNEKLNITIEIKNFLLSNLFI